MTSKFTAFDASSSLEIGGLTLESSVDSLAIYGNLNIDKSQEGLHQLEQLLPILEAARTALLAQKTLPKALETVAPTTQPNPFG